MQGSELNDFTRLDDPDFIAAWARTRQQLEYLPDHHTDRAELQRLYDAMTQEFDRRAHHAWTHSR